MVQSIYRSNNTNGVNDMLTYNSPAEHDKQNHNPIRFADKCENCNNTNGVTDMKTRSHYTKDNGDHVFNPNTEGVTDEGHILLPIHCPLCNKTEWDFFSPLRPHYEACPMHFSRGLDVVDVDECECGDVSDMHGYAV